MTIMQPTGDLTLVFDPVSGLFDLDVAPSGYDLLSGSDLYTVAAVCLFTDARADPDYVPPDGTGDLRGWWGDSYSPTPWGSLLWQYDRAAISDQQETLRGIERAAVTGLEPLVSEGILAASATATASYIGEGAIYLQAQLQQPGPTQAQNLEWVWNTI